MALLPISSNSLASARRRDFSRSQHQSIRLSRLVDLQAGYKMDMQGGPIGYLHLNNGLTNYPVRHTNMTKF